MRDGRHRPSLRQARGFAVTEVCVRQDPATGELILSRRPGDWAGFVQSLKDAETLIDLLSEAERAEGPEKTRRDPLQGLDGCAGCWTSTP